MSIGVWQVILILIVVLIVFGAGKLPKVMGDLGQGFKLFKKGLSDEAVKDSLEGNNIRTDKIKKDISNESVNKN